MEIYTSTLGGELSFYRDRYGLESDFVLHLEDGRYALIECKLGSAEIEEGASHLLKLKQLITLHNKTEAQVPLREPDALIILTAGEMAYRRPDGIMVLVTVFTPKHANRWEEKMDNKMYQVSTLQALALGYSKTVITAGELIREGDTGLGTFEDVNGEMIVMDGHCYRADHNGNVSVVDPETGVPFAAVAKLYGEQNFLLKNMSDIESIRTALTGKIEEVFGLNSMHIVRIDGEFERVDARSEAPYRSHHITLKEVLGQTQTAFLFENIRGSLVGVYFPDYMDGINMPGWHLHFLSEDRSKGGHVFDVSLREGTARVDKITNIYINLPKEAAFDTYSLKQDLQDEIKSVE